MEIKSTLVNRHGQTLNKEFQQLQAKMDVISVHTSMSVLLPVFKVELPDSTTFMMRYNFHDWKISVSAPHDIEANFMGLFNPTERINSIYCEGFPLAYIYGPYAENKRQFTLELPNGFYNIYTFFWIFRHDVLGMRRDGKGQK